MNPDETWKFNESIFDWSSIIRCLLRLILAPLYADIFLMRRYAERATDGCSPDIHYEGRFRWMSGSM